MSSCLVNRPEEDGEHAADSLLRGVCAEGAEAHAAVESNEFAHGIHGLTARHSNETMKCDSNRGDA